MDVYNMYVGDCASTYRNNMFRDYEKHPYGKCLLPTRLRRPTFECGFSSSFIRFDNHFSATKTNKIQKLCVCLSNYSVISHIVCVYL